MNNKKINLSKFNIASLDEDIVTHVDIHRNPDGSVPAITCEFFQDGDEPAKEEPAIEGEEPVDDKNMFPDKEVIYDLVISDDENQNNDDEVIVVKDDDEVIEIVKEEPADPLKIDYESYQRMRNKVLQSNNPALVKLQQQIDLMSNSVFKTSIKVCTKLTKYFLQ